MHPETRPVSTGEAAIADQSLDFMAIWNLLWGNRLLLIAFGVLGGGIAAVVALNTTPLFRAEVTLTEVSNPGLGAVSSLSRQFGGIAALAGINLGGGTSEGADSRAVLNSRKLTEQFLARPKMIEEVFAGAEKPPSLWMAVERFRKGRLSIAEDQRKGTITVSMVAEKPENASRWANEYVALANEALRTRALDDSNRNIAYLNEQLAKTSSVEIQRVMYSLIENETKSAMLANARQEFAFAVVDPAATPEERFSPKRTLMVILGTILGGVVGVVLALIRHLIRRARPATR